MKAGQKLLLKALLALMALLLPVCAQADSLVIAGPLDPARARAYTAEHPDTTITCTGEYFFSAAQLISAMLFGETDFDIMVLWSANQDTDSLMDKHYCAPLDGSEALGKAVAAMYPAVSAAVTRDGHLWALPLSVSWTGMACDEAAFARAGLPVPRSWADIAALINGWPDQPDEVRDAWQVAELVEDYPRWFLLRMTESYVRYLQLTGAPLRFDTPVYRELMVLQSTLTDALNNDPTALELPALLSGGLDVAELPERIPLPLTIDGTEVWSGALYLAFINPYSPHRDAALDFLTWLSAHPSETAARQLYPAFTEPLEAPDYAARLAEWEAAGAALSDALAACPPEERRARQEALDAHLLTRPALEARRYLISPAQVSAWHDIMARMPLPGPSLLDLNEDLFTTLQFRYLDGELSLEGYVREMDSMGRTIEAEQGE